MYHVYTERNYSELSKSLIGEFMNLDEAMACDKKAIEEDSELNYIVEETDGHFNSYGELVSTIVAES